MIKSSGHSYVKIEINVTHFLKGVALWSGDLGYRASARLEDVSGSVLATSLHF